MKYYLLEPSIIENTSYYNPRLSAFFIQPGEAPLNCFHQPGSSLLAINK